jgi:hypothetical protein
MEKFFRSTVAESTVLFYDGPPPNDPLARGRIGNITEQVRSLLKTRTYESLQKEILTMIGADPNVAGAAPVGNGAAPGAAPPVGDGAKPPENGAKPPEGGAPATPPATPPSPPAEKTGKTDEPTK